MRPPIDRTRPPHPDDDDDEARELHAAEIEMDRGLEEERGNSRVKTQLYDIGGAQDQGRLGAAIKTLRLLSSSVRRSFGRFQVVEGRVDVTIDRVAMLEWLVVGLLIFTGTVLWSVGMGIIAAVVVSVYLWWAA